MGVSMVEGEVDPEEFVKENRERIVEIIRQSDDVFARACAWMLLDRYTPDMDAEELRREFDEVDRARA